MIYCSTNSLEQNESLWNLTLKKPQKQNSSYKGQLRTSAQSEYPMVSTAAAQHLGILCSFPLIFLGWLLPGLSVQSFWSLVLKIWSGWWDPETGVNEQRRQEKGQIEQLDRKLDTHNFVPLTSLRKALISGHLRCVQPDSISHTP